jgi:phosphoglycolate phosphatase-like HAD superfamily hydrolase
MIGDTAFDIEMAHAASVAAIGVGWAATHRIGSRRPARTSSPTRFRRCARD